MQLFRNHEHPDLPPSVLASLTCMFNIGQRAAVAAAFKLAGYVGALVVAPINDETERAFLLGPEDYDGLTDRRALEQVLTPLLGRKAWVAKQNARWGEPIPFE
jgi:hypothetical protein